mmetsp:Transcript_35161/g.87307  ORF Transcript_35161/g.87307 Transcript_35161/m.87307 type:complete len:201 (+) Transcript_35161:1112-1714(+)
MDSNTAQPAAGQTDRQTDRQAASISAFIHQTHTQTHTTPRSCLSVCVAPSIHPSATRTGRQLDVHSETTRHTHPAAPPTPSPPWKRKKYSVETNTQPDDTQEKNMVLPAIRGPSSLLNSTFPVQSLPVLVWRVCGGCGRGGGGSRLLVEAPELRWQLGDDPRAARVGVVVIVVILLPLLLSGVVHGLLGVRPLGRGCGSG